MSSCILPSALRTAIPTRSASGSVAKIRSALTSSAFFSANSRALRSSGFGDLVMSRIYLEKKRMVRLREVSVQSFKKNF